MKKFKENKTYSAKSVCDQGCVFTFEITRRTAKSVWIKGSMIDGEARKSIKVWDNQETILPLGSYSMAPILRA